MLRLLSALCFAQALIGSQASAMNFVHPGSLHSQAELDFVKARINERAQPWTAEFERLRDSGFATRQPQGRTRINSQSEDASASRDDSIAAITQALLWYFTDERHYGNGAVAILNSWADLKAFTAGSDQDKLQAGWVGANMAAAAEILRGFSGWKPADNAKLQAMFKRAFYPQLMVASSWNGNVDLTQIEALLSIAVFVEDEAAFELGIERLRKRRVAYFYLVSDGESPASIEGDGGEIEAFWSHPKKWIDGITQETCRDNGHHAQFGLASALHAAEIAWHQGVDVYAENPLRYTAAMELMAKQFLSGSMQGVCDNDSPSNSRFDSWQIGYNHYHHRLGMDLPWTKELIAKQILPGAPRAVNNLAYETLTHTRR
ncbi:alginate lyase family protein [Novipirellula artificiosorum]|uniref:Alginate lyase n=1 Tax=Novipirellula artificiosorum TaxID=2528016 RepID=A0A5C6D6I6_9BACT|nr:alginate lyase family protein [Novipirellula artificiosorum]TWU30856.1 Alginate lyase [Novipirellula artificiosorum]